MPRCSVHHHPCQQCGVKTECGGTWEQNYDGFPEVICREFHKENGTINGAFACEDCDSSDEPIDHHCVDCGDFCDCAAVFVNRDVECEGCWNCRNDDTEDDEAEVDV